MSERTPSMQMIQGRGIAALLNPRPAVLVTCSDEHGAPNVLCVAWHTPLSHEPPLLGISLARQRYSHALICATGEFVVNVVSREFQAAVELCGSHSGRDLDKITAAGLDLQPACHVRPPLIGGALAHLECSLVRQVPAGDHTFFVGQVLYAEARPECFSLEGWDAARGDVLLCVQRDRFGSWSRE